MKKHTPVESYVVQYIQDNVPGIPPSKDRLLEIDYLNEGLIDSLQFLEMISNFEKKFKVQFGSKELQSKSLRTFGGIIESIESLISKK